MISEAVDLPWLGVSRADWLTQVAAFVAPHARGALELVQVRAWAVVLSAPGAEGRVYFKATAPGGRHEPALVAALAEAFGDLVPAPLAIDSARGWMLLPDCGRKLREVRDEAGAVAAWLEVLPRYAELQRASSRDEARWLRLGVPDRSPGRLPGLLAEILEGPVPAQAGLSARECSELRALIPELGDACRRLADIPSTLDHGDLHDGNLLILDGARWLVDWADACVSHPFGSLLVTSRSVAPEYAEKLRDAYLEPWTADAPRAAVLEAFARAQWVAHVGRALDWAWMLAGTGATARAEWLPRVAFWLRAWAAREPVSE